MWNKTKTTRTLCVILLSFLLLLPLISCSAESDYSSDYSDMKGDVAYDSDLNYGMAEDMIGAPSQGAAPEPESSPTVPSGGTTSGAGADQPDTDTEYATKIIRTVTQRAQTKAFDAAISGVEALVAQHGGYVENSYVNGTGYNGSKGSRSASYTIRIPAERLDAFLAESGELYVVSYSNSTVSNVTAQYYDIVTRLETLRAEQESLEGMLKEAKDISTMLQIKDYLYQVIYEIESYETQLKLLDSRVAYSTVQLTLDEVVEYTEVEQTWGERLVAAFKQSWISFGKGFQGFTVFFVAAFPTLLVLGAIAAVVILIVVKVNKKHSPNNKKPGDGA